MTKNKLAIIGGSGLYDVEKFKDREFLDIITSHKCRAIPLQSSDAKLISSSASFLDISSGVGNLMILSFFVIWSIIP